MYRDNFRKIEMTKRVVKFGKVFLLYKFSDDEALIEYQSKNVFHDSMDHEYHNDLVFDAPFDVCQKWLATADRQDVEEIAAAAEDRLADDSNWSLAYYMSHHNPDAYQDYYRDKGLILC